MPSPVRRKVYSQRNGESSRKGIINDGANIKAIKVTTAVDQNVFEEIKVPHSVD